MAEVSKTVFIVYIKKKIFLNVATNYTLTIVSIVSITLIQD